MHLPATDGWRTILDLRPDLGSLPNLNRATVAGISVAIAGNVLISLALNCQKLAHQRLERDRAQTKEEVRDDRSKTAQNGEPRIDEEDEEATPAQQLSRAQQSRHGAQALGAATSAVAVVETHPLVSSPTDAATRNYGTNSTNGRERAVSHPSFFRRFKPWGRRAKSAASSLERTYIGATTSLMPVDVVTVRPVSPHRSDEEPSNGKDQEFPEDANESDYLRSKLWCVHEGNMSATPRKS